MKDHLPKAYAELERIRQALEKHFKDVQDFEFTIEDGTVYMLQTRNGKRTAMAALKFSMDMYKEKLIDWKTAPASSSFATSSASPTPRAAARPCPSRARSS